MHTVINIVFAFSRPRHSFDLKSALHFYRRLDFESKRHSPWALLRAHQSPLPLVDKLPHFFQSLFCHL